MSMHDVRDDYPIRREARQAIASRLARWETLAGRLRLVAFAAIAIIFLVVPTSAKWFPLFISMPAIAFVGLLFWHRHLVAKHAQARRAVQYYARGINRLNDRWQGEGSTGDRYADATHLYSSDLDLFGLGSLYEYLSAATTTVGHDTLASWLLAPASVPTILRRQEALLELRDRRDLRESLGLLVSPKPTEVKTRLLATWPMASPRFIRRRGAIAAIVLGTLGLGGILGWLVFGWGPSPLLLVVLIESIVLGWQWSAIREVTRDVPGVLAELSAFLPTLRLLEAQTFSAPELQRLTAALRGDGVATSQRVARLAKLLDAWDTATRNQFTLPFAIVFMVPLHLVHAIERWRIREGRQVPRWLAAVGEFEALCSLATFADEHRDHAFPTLVESAPTFSATSIAHPLLPASRRVANDIALGERPALLLISGSNMAGKSTLMRAVGINAVLALAGAPVCAKAMNLSPLGVATSMRQSDSLSEGVSSFYAELKRLQAIREGSSGATPVFFLLDEILRGTNSHDRRVGAEAVIQALLNQGGLGMVSTHDLTLAEIVDRLGDRATNVHFEDQIADGKMSFDYRLRPGVVPKGNGLALLRLLGFEV